MRIAVLNRSSRVSDADAAAMVAACAKQLAQHVAPLWGLAVPTLSFVTAGPPIPGSAVVVLLDNPDTDGALGYHEEIGGEPDGKVFASPVLDAGGTVLGDSFGTGRSAACGYSVSATLSHELIELLVDQDVNLFADGPLRSEGSEYALEAADPVEDGSYQVDGIDVSNFALPVWFDPQHQSGPTDYLNKLDGRPFALTSGGYMVVRSGPGAERQVFGERMPGWRRELKQQSARFAARKAVHRVP